MYALPTGVLKLSMHWIAIPRSKAYCIHEKSTKWQQYLIKGNGLTWSSSMFHLCVVSTLPLFWWRAL
ncbi:hypothetical protein MKW98_027414 [Papaver atlanticum]|uniref:Uncharacterized protein n=1 Tax=Papaver atlanticum TaxID=357466 RepID=A0AAD4XWC2_9MAGN|nr:hypothetical protein MKW98_027414 [Papaver atlanticum]